MSNTIYTKINLEKCNGCGLCQTICPADTITIISGKAVITGNRSMHCGQCQAVCPQNAITVEGLNTIVPNIAASNAYKPDIKTLANIIMSRRSCRSYLEKPVDMSILEDLVTLGTWAPSGTNSQDWTFTIIPNRKGVISFANTIGDFFKKLNNMASKKHLRLFSKIFMKNVLGNYYHNYFQQVTDAISSWENDGRDRLFHGASAIILVGSKPSATCKAEDALLATQNILLAAQAINIGTCLIGFAVEAMKKDKTIGSSLKIPNDETIYSVIAIGYPKVKYLKPSGRKKITPHIYSA